LEWCALILAAGLVWVAELLNTALETVVDLASPDRHPLAGKAKDIGAAAVLVAAMIAVLLGVLILGPPLWTRLFGAAGST
jgi:diacylglycerol kinase